jgi:hypothetical protein
MTVLTKTEMFVSRIEKEGGVLDFFNKNSFAGLKF